MISSSPFSGFTQLTVRLAGPVLVTSGAPGAGGGPKSSTWMVTSISSVSLLSSRTRTLTEYSSLPSWSNGIPVTICPVPGSTEKDWASVPCKEYSSCLLSGLVAITGSPTAVPILTFSRISRVVLGPSLKAGGSGCWMGVFLGAAGTALPCASSPSSARFTARTRKEYSLLLDSI